MILLCQIFVFTTLFGVSFQQSNGAPSFTRDMRGLTVPENTPVGKSLYRLEATDPENQPISYGIETFPSGVFEIKNPSDGIVYLKTALNYENLKRLTVLISATDGEKRTEREVLVDIVDVNDEIPAFDREEYKISLPENTGLDAVIWRDLLVTDNEAINQRLEVICDSGLTTGEDTCQRFILVTKERTKNRWRGDIVLKIPLNYARRSEYKMPLRAWDGVNEARRTFTILVTDVQNQPPVFTSPLSVVVNETVSVGTVILTVKAADGDTGNPRPIRYELTSDTGNFFRIDPISGAVSTNKKLDREDSRLSDGYHRFFVTAREVISNNVLGSDSTTSTRVTVTITVLDVNDNAPKFQQSQYETSMREDVAVGYPVINMLVSDDDVGINAEFSLHLTRYNDVFEIFPTSGRGRAFVQLRVKDNKNVDYDKGLRQYIIPVVARETKTAENRTSETQVIVNVQNVDDNVPRFTQSSYTASVSELAVQGTPVTTITASDDDGSGSAGINSVAYFLLGNGADRFKVGIQTGLVTVAACATPGRGSCIDFEARQQFQLTLAATVNSGNAATVTVPLIINVIDSNDVTPQFTADTYLGFINEGEQAPSPTLQVKAVDGDSALSDNNKVVYSILSSSPPGLFTIGQSTGVITATRPVRYDNTPDKIGRFRLTVQASDGINKATTTVGISVIDRNDHAPAFRLGGSIGSYVKFIPETSKAGTDVILVDAVDDDPGSSPNGQITYHIESGSRDKFVINRNTGQISVAEGATFDYDKIKRYQMKVIATDKGLPQYSGVTTVIVNIRDSNNKSPYFPTPVIRADVSEDKVIGSKVITLQAVDPDLGAQLSYSILDPKRAWDPRGKEANTNTFDFRELFSVEQMTGVVRVKQNLQREKAAVISLTVKAVDIFGGGQQSGTATLLITILNVNDKPPVFAPPWTSSVPSYNISVKEEQLPGAFVTVVVASDPDGSISKYEVKDDPGGFFSVESLTGVVSLQKPIDYEKTQQKQFTVVAYDNGEPQLSSSATIYVSVENINDLTPKFAKDAYSVIIPENAPEGTSVTTVVATDGDAGTFGAVKYSLQATEKRFSISPTSGLISVKQNADLDREVTPVIVFTVTANDSPERPEFKRSNTVPVYVTLSDVNDNSPKFAWSAYDAVIVENSRVGSPIVQLSANDQDTGNNSQLLYYKISGDPQDYFAVNELTGQVTVNQTLLGKAGTYSVVIGVKDQPVKPADAKSSKVTMTVKVISVNNAAPVWITPSKNDIVIDVLENQYNGMVITEVEARDVGQGVGQVTYGFLHNNQFTYEMPGFGINPYTGIIRARRTFDREEKDSYSLMLVARDNGNPPFESTRSLSIRILDVNDHQPEFPAFYNCCNIPYNFSILENTGGFVGVVKAVDKDMGQYASMTYRIIAGNQNNAFTINGTTGEIRAIKPLDRELQESYILTVEAKDNNGEATGSEVTTRPERCACRDPPSVVTVKVMVGDINDNVPVFPQQAMFACVSLQAAIGHMVTQVTATDSDSGVNSQLAFSTESVTNVNEYGDEKSYLPGEIFLISSGNGSVYVNSPLTKFDKNYFMLKINVEDGTGSKASSDLRIWMTKPTQLLVATVDQGIVAARRDISNIKLLLSKLAGGAMVYVQQIRYHVDEGGIINPAKTDVLFYVIRNKVLDVYDARTVAGIMWGEKGDAAAVGTYRTEVAAAGLVAVQPVYNSFLGFWIDPVLAAVIIILILLFIMLLILCCVCLCIHRAYKKQIKRIRYDENKTLIVATGRINPLWKEKLYDEHASIEAFDNAAFEGDSHRERTEVDENVASAAAAAVTAASSAKREVETTAEVSISSDHVDSAGDADTARQSGGASLLIRPTETVTTETRVEHEYSMNYEHKKMETLRVDNADGADVESALAGYMDFTSEYGGASEYAASGTGKKLVSEVGSGAGSGIGGAAASLSVASAAQSSRESASNNLYTTQSSDEYRIETTLAPDPHVPQIEVEVPREESLPPPPPPHHHQPPHRVPDYTIQATIVDPSQPQDMASNLSGSGLHERGQLTVDTSMHTSAAAVGGAQYFGQPPVLYVDQHAVPPSYPDISVQGQPASDAGSLIGATVEQSYISQAGAPSGRRAGGAAAYIQQRYGSGPGDYGSLRDPDPNLFRPAGTRFLKRGQVQNVSYGGYGSYPQSPNYPQSASNPQSPSYHQSTSIPQSTSYSQSASYLRSTSSSGGMMQHSERDRASYDTLMYDTLPVRNTQYKDADIHIIAPAHTIPQALASPGGSIQQHQQVLHQQSQVAQQHHHQSLMTQQQQQPSLMVPSPRIIVTSDREAGAYGGAFSAAAGVVQPLAVPSHQQAVYSEYRREETQPLNNDYNW